MSNSTYITLEAVPPGRKARIIGLDAGPGLATRLMQMGLTPGIEVEVVSGNRGPILVKVRGVMIALSRGMARKIFVEII
ncbi:MAG: ferrous iron transport protein A [Thermoprotei archaeon]|nr:MAG: ferrous iron transport protein A [Thermoprotei archaeon]